MKFVRVLISVLLLFFSFMVLFQERLDIVSEEDYLGTLNTINSRYRDDDELRRQMLDEYLDTVIQFDDQYIEIKKNTNEGMVYVLISFIFVIYTLEDVLNKKVV